MVLAKLSVFEMERYYYCANRVAFPKPQANNANAGELLDLASLKAGAFKRLAGTRGLRVKSAIY